MKRFVGTLLSVLAVSLFLGAPSADAMSIHGRWLGAEGVALPFDDDGVLEFLRTAPVVAEKRLSDGINKPMKLTLERDGIRVNAIFRTVNVEKANLHNAAAHDRKFRDSYIFEVAAYELGRMLGLRSIPPAALREIDGQKGSIQLWVEQAMSEAERIERRLTPKSPARWQLQRHNMAVFDNLIYNFDRNHGNQLQDDSGKLWFVDHTRSFKQLPKLAAVDKVRFCERSLYEGLRTLDPKRVREVLAPYLRPVEISALLARHKRLMQRLDTLVAELGETGVLFELAPQGTQLASL